MKSGDHDYSLDKNLLLVLISIILWHINISMTLMSTEHACVCDEFRDHLGLGSSLRTVAIE